MTAHLTFEDGHLVARNETGDLLPFIKMYK
jgi:hypothetical protein